MPARERFILITGRSLKQGVGLQLGKNSPEYLDEVSMVDVNKDDMKKLGLQDGRAVHLKTEYAEITVRCRSSAGLPQGLIFMPYGPPANAITISDTGGTGIPDFKGIEVELEIV